MSAQPDDALITIGSVKEPPAVLEETLLLSYIATRGRGARKRMVTHAANQTITYCMPGRKNMLPCNGWTSQEQRVCGPAHRIKKNLTSPPGFGAVAEVPLIRNNNIPYQEIYVEKKRQILHEFNLRHDLDILLLQEVVTEDFFPEICYAFILRQGQRGVGQS